MKKLSKTMSVSQFDNGYWYATEIKAFAKSIGIKNVSGLRKDELEKLIRSFLKTGKTSHSRRQMIDRSLPPDAESGLSLQKRIRRYNNDKATKDFLEREASKHSGYRRRSGARYRLNRWREEQMAKGPVTYGQLVKAYVRLSAAKVFKKVPSGRYINFLSEFGRFYPKATRAQALKAWKQLKKIDAPKTFRSWKRHFEK